MLLQDQGNDPARSMVEHGGRTGSLRETFSLFLFIIYKVYYICDLT